MTDIYKHCECKNSKELIQLIRSNGIETIELSWPDDMGLWYTTTIKSHEVSLQNLVEGIKFATQSLLVDSSSARFDTSKACKSIVVKCSIQTTINNNNSNNNNNNNNSTPTSNNNNNSKQKKTSSTTRLKKKSKKNNNHHNIEDIETSVAVPPDLLLSPLTPYYSSSSSDTSETDEIDSSSNHHHHKKNKKIKNHNNNNNHNNHHHHLIVDESPLSFLIDQVENERSRVGTLLLVQQQQQQHDQYLSSDDETNSSSPSSPSPRNDYCNDPNSPPLHQQCPGSPSTPSLSSSASSTPIVSGLSYPSVNNNKRKERDQDWLELPKNKVDLVPDLSNALAVAIQVVAPSLATTAAAGEASGMSDCVASSPSVGTVPNTTEFSLDNTERLIIEGQIQLPPLLRPRQYHACKVNKEEKLKDKESKRKKNHTMLCRHCGTNSTPEWRRGPDGRKSLCNACGLHYSKTIKRETINKQQENRTFNIIDLLNPVL
ncbi:putative GATA-binding transcription factor [Cavenderia fasciculata]|uniref:GATA-binding transcription factor n=1 Tax=Cavenderia fasciculata TaxID=261658 RepID=F4PI12_CACFS|nr:putative GATA-binding transcription factor [Cavenderia fasciculata]EGG24499.1 putative GATA-binding transcription factor [Cavenderia fasciculata]|eukprot:XP_004362350.1 putative GATA-binding transcription factor [Cavenderia fasciculata]